MTKETVPSFGFEGQQWAVKPLTPTQPIQAVEGTRQKFESMYAPDGNKTALRRTEYGLYASSIVQSRWMGWKDAIIAGLARPQQVPVALPAEPYQGPKKFTPEEIADGNKGIRWVNDARVCGLPTSHDMMENLQLRGENAFCSCQQCREFFTLHPQGDAKGSVFKLETNPDKIQKSLENYYKTGM